MFRLLTANREGNSEFLLFELCTYQQLVIGGLLKHVEFTDSGHFNNVTILVKDTAYSSFL